MSDTNEVKKFEDKLVKKNWFTAFFSPKKWRIATVLLYERVDNIEIFLGAYPFMKGKIKDLGEYCYININGKKVFMNSPHYKDYTPAKNNKIGKILEVVKFAEDDFRVRGRLNDTFFTIRKKQVTEKIVICKNCEAEWAKCVCQDKSDMNKVFINKPVFNKDGTPKMEEVKETWQEPKGVTQEGRNSLREQNSYIKKMEEHKAKNDFFAKYGALMTIAIVALACVFLVLYSVNSVNKNLQITVDKVGQVNKAQQWWTDPNALKSITTAVSNQQKQNEIEAKAPPS